MLTQEQVTNRKALLEVMQELVQHGGLFSIHSCDACALGHYREQYPVEHIFESYVPAVLFGLSKAKCNDLFALSARYHTAELGNDNNAAYHMQRIEAAFAEYPDGYDAEDEVDEDEDELEY